MKMEEKNIVRQISAFKASVIKKLDELEKSTLLEIAFTQFMQRASSQSTHHLVAGVFSSILVHGSQLVFNDIPKGVKTNPQCHRSLSISQNYCHRSLSIS
jgi:hypothetical protein